MTLKEFRLTTGMTIEELAKYVGISKSMYEKMEQYERNPSVETMNKFKKAFGTFDMNIFFTR